jgi:hypothetical protein
LPPGNESGSIKEIIMSVQAITGVSTQTQQLLQKTKARSDQAKGKAPLEGMLIRGEKYGLATFEQASVAQLMEIVGDAAKKLGVGDLATFDTSPEATADRIANFAIGMYSIYKKQNPDMEETDRLEKYDKMIRRAINKGFREAAAILKGVNAMTRPVEKNILETYDLVQKRLDDFFDQAKADAAQSQAMA